jgi:hypothetical protein
VIQKNLDVTIVEKRRQGEGKRPSGIAGARQRFESATRRILRWQQQASSSFNP